MSLFDLESGSSLSSSTSSASDEGVLPMSAPPPPPTVARGACPPFLGSGFPDSCHRPPLSPLEQRRRIAERDAGRCPTRGPAWRKALLTPTPPVSNASQVTPPPLGGSSSHGITSAGSLSGGAGKFGNSVAAALHLRKEEQDKMLLRRLQTQRRAEEEGEEGRTLLQKDMEVGIFVTASYKAFLQRNLHLKDDVLPPKTESSEVLGANPTEKTGTEDEDDGPLAAYLQELESSRDKGVDSSMTVTATSVPTGDYYNRMMRAPIEEEKAVQIRRAATTRIAGSASLDPAVETTPGGVEANTSTPIPSPVSVEEQSPTKQGITSTLPALHAHSVEGTQRDHNPEVGRHDGGEIPSAVLSHAQLVYDAREAKSRGGATPATLAATARRCDGRIATSLGVSFPQ